MKRCITIELSCIKKKQLHIIYVKDRIRRSKIKIFMGKTINSKSD